MLPHLFSQEEQVVDNVFGFPGELLTELWVLCRNAYGTGVQVTFAHHGATHDDKWCSGETELVGAQKGGHDHIEARSDLPIGLEDHPENKSTLRTFGPTIWCGTTERSTNSEK